MLYREGNSSTPENPRFFSVDNAMSLGILGGKKMSFTGHKVEQKAAGAEPITYVLKSVGCTETSFGAPVQNFCPEMQRWDDYRAAAHIQDGLPSLVATFCPNGRWQQVFSGHSVRMPSQTGPSDVRIKSIMATQELMGATDQNFTPEMMRYDDYAEIGLAPKLPTTMAAAFLKQPPFTGHIVDVPLPSGEKSVLLVKCITAAAGLCGAARQPFSPEMLRWDDIRAASRINDGTPPMSSLCGI